MKGAIRTSNGMKDPGGRGKIWEGNQSKDEFRKEEGPTGILVSQ